MNTRWLALAVVALVAFAGLTPAAYAEIVVLINGNRMDVKSYEIQAHVVVVETWDGKTQSFPITWVDVEATKNVSHQFDPTEGIPPARLEKARALLDTYGVRDAMNGLFDEVDNEIRNLQAKVSGPTYDVIRGAFRNAYNGERIFEVVAADFARYTDDALLDRWSTWLRSPETMRILAMENAEPGDNDNIEQSRYLADLYANPDTVYRQELIARLDRAVRASEAGLEIAGALAAALQDTRFLVLPDPPPRADVDEIRTELWPRVREATIDSLLFTYRSATHEELIRYIEFWESSDGQQISEMIVQALASGVQYGTEMAVHGVAAGTGGTLEN